MSLQALVRGWRCGSYHSQPGIRRWAVSSTLQPVCLQASNKLQTQNYYIGDTGVIGMVLLKCFTTRYDGMDWIPVKHCGRLHALVGITELPGS
jgi:hypothetical protein